MRLSRILILAGLAALTIGIFVGSVVADEGAVPRGLVTLALASINVGAVVLVIGVQTAAAERTESFTPPPREPEHVAKIVLTSFRRCGVVIVLLGLLITLSLGDRLTHDLAPLFGPGFIAAWCVDLALSWFVRSQRRDHASL